MKIASRFLGILALALPVSAMACGALVVRDPYVRLPPPKAMTAGGFMALANNGAKAVRLVSVASPLAEVSELHTHVEDQGVMRMRAVESIRVDAGATVELAPGGLHVMLINLKRPLQEGDSVPITLACDNGSSSEIKAVVRALPAHPMKH